MNLMDWTKISKEKNLSFAFLKENEKNIIWMELTRSFPLTKELFETFPNVFSNTLNWEGVVRNPSFTMEFLEEIKDESFVSWKTISIRYPVTKEMWDRFSTYLNLDLLLLNPHKKVDIVRTDKLVDGGNIESVYTFIEKKEGESTPQTFTFTVAKNRNGR